MSDEEMPKELGTKTATGETVGTGTSSLWDFGINFESICKCGFRKNFLVSNAKQIRKEVKSLWDFEGTNRKGFCKPSLEFMYI